MARLGIDLGGTNIVVGLVDDDCSIKDRISCKTALPRSAESIAEDMGRLCQEIIKRNGLQNKDIEAVGAGIPGTVNKKTGIVEYANNLGFENVPLAAMLKKYIDIPLFMDNDANAAAWGEYKAGGYKEDSFVLITLGTGIGGGVILDGKLLHGINYAGGELGHTTINFKGRPCNCGRTGCFEVYGSASALIEQTRDAMAFDRVSDHLYEKSVLWTLCGGNIDNIEAKSVFDAVSQGDELANILLDEYTTYLSEGIANIINIFQPAVFCIGGGVSKAGKTLLDPLKKKTAKLIYSRNSAVNTEITLARFDNDAGIIGAALLNELP